MDDGAHRWREESHLEHVLHFFSFRWIVPRARVDLVDVTAVRERVLEQTSRCRLEERRRRCKAGYSLVNEQDGAVEVLHP